jgi:hypothetical protein
MFVGVQKDVMAGQLSADVGDAFCDSYGAAELRKGAQPIGFNGRVPVTQVDYPTPCVQSANSCFHA